MIAPQAVQYTRIPSTENVRVCHVMFELPHLAQHGVGIFLPLFTPSLS
jgi:hypothetical protein